MNNLTSRQHRQQAMERTVADFERSGLTRRDFSERTGIALSTLDYWRRRIHHRRTPALLPVHLDPASSAGRGFHLLLPNGVRIESDWDFPPTALAQLLELAGER